MSIQEKISIYSRIAELKIEVTSLLTRNLEIPYDTANHLFTSSITYQLLMDITTELYNQSITQIELLFEKEQELKKEINKTFKTTNNKMVDHIQYHMQKTILKDCLLNHLTLDESYQNQKRKTKNKYHPS